MKSIWMFALVLFVWAGPVLADPIDVLVIDETESLIESLAVNLIVGLLKAETTLFARVETVFATVDSAYDFPFNESPTDQRFDLIIVIPKGALQVGRIWLVTVPFPQNYPPIQNALLFLRELGNRLSQQFNLSLALLDVNEDGFVGLLSTFFSRLGLLKPAATTNVENNNAILAGSNAP